MNRKKVLITFATIVAFALMVWTIGATVNLTAINFSASSGDVVSASDFNSAFGTVDSNFADVENALNSRAGVTNSFQGAYPALTTTTQEIDSVTIQAPGAGFVEVRAHGFFETSHVNGGGTDYPRAYLSTSSATADFDNLAIGSVFSGEPSGFHYETWAITMIQEIPSAGSYTYYLNGDVASQSGTGNNALGRSNLIATYYPNSYGTVTATSSLMDASAETTSPSGR